MPAIMLPHGCEGLRVRRRTVLWTFRRPFMGRPVPRQLLRNELLDLTTIVPATAYHRRSYTRDTVGITCDGCKNTLVFPSFLRGFTRYRDATKFYKLLEIERLHTSNEDQAKKRFQCACGRGAGLTSRKNAARFRPKWRLCLPA